MRIRTKALLCTLLVSLAACGADEITRAAPTVTGALANHTSGDTCVTLTKAATQYQAPLGFVINTSVDSIAYNCRTEMCGTGIPVQMQFVQDGNSTNKNDQMLYKCQSGGITSGWYPAFGSENSCWNCVSGCATNCPQGYECFPIVANAENPGGTVGPDCTPFKCDIGPDGKIYQLRDRGYGVRPDCVRTECPPPPLTISVAGPSSIRPGASCTWTATPGGGETGGSFSITWYVAGVSLGTGTSYTGGKPGGVSGANWSLKAEVSQGTHSTYTLFPITESSNAPLCMD